MITNQTNNLKLKKMKTLKLNALALVAFLAIGISSCSKDDNTTTTPVTPAPGSIAAIASGNANLSLLVKALGKAGLVQTLTDAGTYTVFAPTNTAFEAANINAAYIDAQTTPAQVEALKQVLLNHVLATKKTAAELTTGYVKTLAKGAASDNKLSMYVDATSGVKLNGGAKVDATLLNIQASNGIIHVVDKVITLPTIVTHATANGNFSQLVGKLTSTGQPDFVGILGGTTDSPFTVFAPTNAAFDALTPELVTLNVTVTPAILTNVLKYHVKAGANVLATTLTNNQVVTTFLGTTAGQSFTVQLPTSGAQIKDANNRISKIVATDVQCSNGVIHVLDKVLLPALN
jgi:uncharacterized surface protein with fasciclin (FAS1) repeats